MTRLVNFGLGEVCDRVSILALKILYGEEKGVDISHFKNERNALMPKLLLRETGRWLEHYADLAAVNAVLWQLEDAIRIARDDKTTDLDELRTSTAWSGHVMNCAFRIATLNDRRAQLIQQINALVGDPAVEKV